MCGIAVVVSAEGRLSAADVDPGVECLRHRGPDGSGTWVSRCGRAVLGHTRLAVIDLAGGRQPLHSADGNFHLVANGEFYGYEAIRADLLRRGHPLRTLTDSEIALYLYADMGASAMDRLRGEFAFAIWDQRRGELFAARDRFGVKPLYYARHAGRVLIASEVRALFALGVPARWDESALAAHLLVCVPADRTLFEGVRQVPPGCWLRTDGTDVRIGGYWDLDLPAVHELPEDLDREKHVAAIRDAVVESITLRLRADVPVAAHLSGGMDSGGIVGVVARHGRPATFTVRFDDTHFDEGERARAVAGQFSADHTEILFSRPEFVTHIERTVACGQMPQENSHGIARLLQSEAIRRAGYKVVLAGEGGDEVFAGYPHFQQDLALSLSPAARSRADAAYARLLRGDPPAHLRLLLDRLGFIPAWIAHRYLGMTTVLRDLLRPGFAAELARIDPLAGLFDGVAATQLDRRKPYHQSVYLFCKTWLCNYLLAAERLDMSTGLEVRLPFLDHQVIEVVKHTPLSWFTGSGSKPLLRDVLDEYLVHSLSYSEKHPFFAPESASDDAVLRRMTSIITSDTLDSLPFFDPGAVRAALRRLAALPPERRIAFEPALQLMTGLILLTREFRMPG